MSLGVTLASIKVIDELAMHQLGLNLARLLDAGDMVLLTGPLGAGKTTMTRGVGEGLGVIGTVSSPTFVIARTHKREASPVPLVHVDAYRLGSPADFDDLDGMTVNGDTWWFNVRPSNTEPLLRLNLEARDRATVDAKVAEVSKHLGHRVAH